MAYSRLSWTHGSIPFHQFGPVCVRIQATTRSKVYKEMVQFARIITCWTCLLVDFAQSKIWNAFCDVLKDVRLRGWVGKQRGLYLITRAFCAVICQETFNRNLNPLTALQQIKHDRVQIRFQPAVSAFTTWRNCMPKWVTLLVHAATTFSCADISTCHSGIYALSGTFGSECGNWTRAHYIEFMSLQALYKKWYQHGELQVWWKVQNKTSHRCPVFYELFIIAAKKALAILGDVLLNMPHTQQNRSLRKLLLQCRDQGKFLINCKDFWQSIDE